MEKKRLAQWLLDDIREVQQHPDFPVGLCIPWTLTVLQLLTVIKR